MDFLFDPIKEILIDMIMNMLGTINNALNNSSADLPLTPREWNPEVYNFIRLASSNVILPIAGIILTFIACYEMISMVIDRNNMNDVFAQDLFKWLFKTMFSIIMLSNMFVFIESIFLLSSELVQGIATLSHSSTTPDLTTSINDIIDTLDALNIGELMLILMECGMIWVGFYIINSFVLPMIIAARMFNIYILMTLSPIPFSTFGNKEYSNLGQNYIKSLFAIGLQAVLMQVCFVVYEILLTTAFTGSGATGSPMLDIALYFVYGILLVMMLWKTGAMAKSIVGAH